MHLHVYVHWVIKKSLILKDYESDLANLSRKLTNCDTVQ